MKNSKITLLVVGLGIIIFLIGVLLLKHSSIDDFTRESSEFFVNRKVNSLSKFITKEESITSARYLEDGKIEIEIHGFQIFGSDELKQVFSENLHVTEQLGLYSLKYIYPLLEERRVIKTEDCTSIQSVLEIVEETLDQIDSPTKTPDLKFNDHAVSVRLESLIHLKAIMREKSCFDPDLDTKINKHIEYANTELLDPKKFTWSTNHGLMQLRALLAFEYSLEQNRYTNSVRSRIDDIVSNHTLLDFYIAGDGSVYEAATGYWHYIYQQWKIIASYPYMSGDRELQARLNKTREFLNALATNNGFFQGVGDSYNHLIEDYASPEHRNDLFRFENGTAGFNLTDSKGNNLNLLFISLDNKPHVKKHPEDLSVYLFYNEPFFINPGVYAWDGSGRREYVKSQKVQNTVYDTEYSEPDSSSLDSVRYTDHQIILSGRKWYGEKFIEREIRYSTRDRSIQILDYPFNKRTTITGFNLYPNFLITKKDDYTLSIAGQRGEIEIRSNVAPRVVAEAISDRMNNLIKVDRIQYEGLVDTLKIMITPIQFSGNNDEIIIRNNEGKDRQRVLAGQILSDKYGVLE